MKFSFGKLAGLGFANVPTSADFAARSPAESGSNATPSATTSAGSRRQSTAPDALQRPASREAGAANVEDVKNRNAQFQQVATKHVPLSGMSANTIALLKKIKGDLRMANTAASANPDIQSDTGLASLLLLHPSDVEIESEADLRALSRMEPSIRSQITGIALSDIDITRRGLISLRRFPALKSLTLEDCNARDASLRAIKNLTQLKSLYIDGCMQITDDGLLQLKDMKQLELLRLDECPQISDLGLAHLRGLTALETLELTGCDKLTDGGLSTFENFTRLRSLTLGWCANLTGEGFGRFKKMDRLRELDLTGCSNVQKVATANLRTLTTLQLLTLAKTRIGNEGLRNLKDMPQLEVLSLNSALRVDDKGLEHLRFLPKLQDVELAGTNVTKASRASFLDSLRGKDKRLLSGRCDSKLTVP